MFDIIKLKNKQLGIILNNINELESIINTFDIPDSIDYNLFESYDRLCLFFDEKFIYLGNHFSSGLPYKSNDKIYFIYAENLIIKEKLKRIKEYVSKK